jgi:hypothetical protein
MVNNILMSDDIKKNIPVLLAHIFAIWTLENTDHYFKAKKSKKSNE